jgi:hypothetical protein
MPGLNPDQAEDQQAYWMTQGFEKFCPRFQTGFVG